MTLCITSVHLPESIKFCRLREVKRFSLTIFKAIMESMAEKSTTKRSHRIFALTMAVLFLVTASAFSIVVILQLVDQHNQNKAAESAAQTSSASQAPKNQLQGTKLAGFTPVSSVSKLKTIDTKVGTGQAVKPGDTVTVNYTGAVAATGVIFQSSLDSLGGQPPQPATFKLQAATPSQQGVIDGWVQGIPGMKVGGTRRLLIPANLAYGASPPPNSGIPVNAPLVFDVTLIKIGS